MKTILPISIIMGILTFGLAQGPYTLSYDLSQFEFTLENGYDRVKGIEMSVITDTGAPELPVKSLNFILPNGNRVENVEILSLSLVPVAGTYNIYPVQPPRRLDDTLPPLWVPPDSTIYSTDALYPDSIPIQVIHRGAFSGIPGVMIAVYPLLYNPVKDSLYLVQSVTFKFTLESVPLSQRPQIMGKRVFQIYKNSIKNSVYNYWEAESYYTPPPLVPDEELLTRGHYEAVIVTSSEMAPAFQPLAKWLVEKGMPTMIVTLDWIYAMYDGRWTTQDYAGWSAESIGDDAAKIKEFLYAAHWQHGLAFAILGGASQYIYPQNYFPCRYSVAYSPHIPTDLYFQDFTGNWPDNPDYVEEIYICRVPAWNYDQALSWVEKRLTYEKSPANRNLMNRSLWITQEKQPPDSIDFIAWMDSAITYFPPNIIHHRVISHQCNPGNHGLIDTLSIGYGMLSTYGHGAPDNQRTAYPNLRQLLFSWPYYYNNSGIMPNLREPDNVDKYYIVYSIGCVNAWFDTSKAYDGSSWTGWTAWGPYPCMAEAFTSFYRLGIPPDPGPAINAVAFLGNTREGWSGFSMWLHQNFIKGLFYRDTLIGIAEAKARYAGPHTINYWYIYYTHNLFGSPEMPVWTENPKGMIAMHPDAIPANIPVNFEVTIYEDTAGVTLIPVENALVTLYKEGPEVYQSQITNAEGKAYFNITAPTTGIMKVTATKHNFIPYQGDVRVFEFDVDIPTTHTAYSEGKKLVRQPNTENLHLGFTWVDFVGGVNGPDDWASYSFSTDGGATWAEGQNIHRFTRNPSIGLTTESTPRPCLAFCNSPEQYLLDQPAIISFARYDEPNWIVTTIDSYPCIPGTWYPRVSPPSIRIDANNIVHMVYSGVLYFPNKAYVIYKRFDAFNPSTETVVIDSAIVPEDWEPSSPSIDLQYGYPHIVYDFPPEASEPYPDVWYKCLTETGWSDPVNISNLNGSSFNRPSVHPFIYLTHEKAIVVWSEEEITGNAESREIYKA